MTPRQVHELPCRCVYNRAAVDADGNCKGCGDAREEAWYASVLAGRVGTFTSRDSEEVATPLPVERLTEGTLFLDDEEVEG